MSFPRLRSEETEQCRQPQTATGQAEGQRAPGARPSSPSLLLALGLGVFFGVGACPPGKGGVLLNAAALENGVKHRGGELAGRSVGEMVGDRPGLGEGGRSRELAGARGAAPCPWARHPSPRVTAAGQEKTWHPVEPKVFPACAGHQSGKGGRPHPATHQHLQAGPVLDTCAASPHPRKHGQGCLPPPRSGERWHPPQVLLQSWGPPASPSPTTSCLSPGPRRAPTPWRVEAPQH